MRVSDQMTVIDSHSRLIRAQFSYCARVSAFGYFPFAVTIAKLHARGSSARGGSC